MLNNSFVENNPVDLKNEVSDKKSRQAWAGRCVQLLAPASWAKLIQKVYEVDPLKCPKCESSMKVIAIIQDKSEIAKIIACLEKKNRAPP